MNSKLFYLLTIFGLLACFNTKNSKTNPQNITISLSEEDIEAREDSIKLAETYLLMENINLSISPVAETTPVGANNMDDAADDPAFWYNVITPGLSLIFGTNKKGGIYAYDLMGKEKKYYPIGKINNIDIRNDVLLGNKKTDIIGGSNRTDNSIILYEIEPDGTLKNLLTSNFKIDTTEIDEVYGFCLSIEKEGTALAIINGKNGRINAYEIKDKNGFVALSLKYTWKMQTQPEGMVADDDNATLFIGEEEKGIWKVKLTEGAEPLLIKDSQKQCNPLIEYDIEGLAIYKGSSGSHGKGFLLASIQGNFSYAVFERSGQNRYISSFKIVKSERIDGVEETDGIEIFSQAINKSFPKGLLIVQDGFNYKGGQLESQNFKLIDFGDVLEIINNQPK